MKQLSAASCLLSSVLWHRICTLTRGNQSLLYKLGINASFLWRRRNWETIVACACAAVGDSISMTDGFLSVFGGCTIVHLVQNSQANSGGRQELSQFRLRKLARIFHELLSRDREDGRATWQPSRGTAGLVPRRT